ncbi:hypothetical protein CHUAL_002566 [Chamberlinius hualienensis]
MKVVKNHNNTSGQNTIDCDMFEELDAIWGMRDMALAGSLENIHVMDSTDSSQAYPEMGVDNSSEDCEITIEEFVPQVVLKQQSIPNSRKRKFNDWIDKFIDYDKTEKRLAQDADFKFELQLAERQEKVTREENEKNRMFLEKLNQREMEHEAEIVKTITNAMIAMSQACLKR